MELGEKLRQARLDAGLSQRQLCGDEITRNMLSQIEHGSAKPSMGTLRYLAARLGKPVSFFLEEDAVLSPNSCVMEKARLLFDSGNYPEAAAALEGYRGPDPVFDREKTLLELLNTLHLAEYAIGEGREPYARELLERAEELGRKTAYCREDLNRRRLLLLGRIRGQAVCDGLPSLDEELLLRAEEALTKGEIRRADTLLEAAQNRKTARWQFLRGLTLFAGKEYREAARCFHQAESEYPRQTAEKLEACYRELEDYKRAYEYACKQKEV